ncbi:MAG: hypothetical protein KGN36_00790, partial [Acidobacteriota bacterium]|nr:hypothetical protein [Acidobacteriota bacterium]
LNLETGHVRRLATGLRDDSKLSIGLAVTSDGKSVIAQSDAGDGSRILSIPASGRGPVTTLFTTTSIAWAIDTAPDGSLYLTGYTLSTDFYTVNAPQPGWGGGVDIFIAQIKPGAAGRGGVLFSTYFGQTGQYVGKSLAMGADGRLYTGGMATGGLPSSFNGSGFGGEYDGFLIVLQ